MILLRRLLTTVSSVTQKVLRGESYSPRERKVSDVYLLGFGIALTIAGLFDLSGIIDA